MQLHCRANLPQNFRSKLTDDGTLSDFERLPTFTEDGKRKHEHERTGEGAIAAGRLCACELSAGLSRPWLERLCGVVCECALDGAGTSAEPAEQGHREDGRVQRALGVALPWPGRPAWERMQE